MEKIRRKASKSIVYNSSEAGIWKGIKNRSELEGSNGGGRSKRWRV